MKLVFLQITLLIVGIVLGSLVRFDDSKIQWFNVDNAISVTVR